MLRYKCDIMQKLKNAGYNTNNIRKNRLLGQSELQKIRKNQPVGITALSRLCSLLNCQPGDLLEYVPDNNDPPGPGADQA
ncbi:MAG: helix-turn-helix transcriptional regulator [Ruminococcus sp.]|nr:helix-turn-helix transcriptional regulator [Ruminococcus sp.]